MLLLKQHPISTQLTDPLPYGVKAILETQQIAITYHFPPIKASISQVEITQIISNKDQSLSLF